MLYLIVGAGHVVYYRNILCSNRGAQRLFSLLSKGLLTFGGINTVQADFDACILTIERGDCVPVDNFYHFRFK